MSLIVYIHRCFLDVTDISQLSFTGFHGLSTEILHFSFNGFPRESSTISFNVSPGDGVPDIFGDVG